MKDALLKFKGKSVVLDTRSAWLYVGTLSDVTGSAVILENVDVHDVTDTKTNKELYIHESRVSGVKENRNLVYVNLDYVISFSPLEDIRKF